MKKLICFFMNDPSSPLFLREPEMVTSDEFTCYGCLREGDGDGFLEECYENNAYHLGATDFILGKLGEGR